MSVSIGQRKAVGEEKSRVILPANWYLWSLYCQLPEPLPPMILYGQQSE
jgi:hypothetical protein